MNLTDLLKALAGKKTYLTSIATCVIVFGAWQGWWHVPVEAYAVLLAGAIAFLRSGVNSQPATPAAPADQTSSVPIKTIVPAFLALTAVALIGCAPLQPGADPLVVNVERSETIAKGSFDLVLNIDHSHRDFWKAKAPAFHEFAEDLRTPQIIGTNTLPRCSALLLSLDDVKLAYQTGRASSNDLQTAWSTLQATLNQANAWLTIVTNTPTQ